MQKSTLPRVISLLILSVVINLNTGFSQVDNSSQLSPLVAARYAACVEEDGLVKNYASLDALQKLIADVVLVAKVAPKDKDGFYDMLYAKFMYEDRGSFINKVIKHEITASNVIQYFELKKKEYASYYQNSYLKGITSLINENSNPFTAKAYNPPPSVQAACTNVDFEMQNFTGWTGNYATSNCTFAGTPNIRNIAGLNIGPINSTTFQHTIMTAGNDPVGLAAVPCNSPFGGAASCRLSDVTDGCSAADLKQTFTVTSANANFTYAYAVVMYDGHPANDAPKFNISMTDGAGNPIVCAAYSINATQASAAGSGFVQSSIFGLWYKPWSRVFVPLQAYIGQNVTIRFVSSDCNGGAHRGYAYVDCSCAPFQLLSSSPIVCNGNNVTLTAPAGAQTYSWSVIGPGNIVGSTTSQTATVNTGGHYHVVMTSFGSGCTYILDTIIPGNPNSPVAAFSTVNVCVGQINTFTNNTTGNPPITYSWNFGDATSSTLTNPTHTYLAAGTYTVTLNANNGCPGTTTRVVTVYPLPTAAFTAPPVCVGTATSFSNTSTGGTTYSWTFGDATSSTLQSPTHIYASAGTYNVSLTVTSANGCTRNITQNIVVNPSPTAAFAANTVCVGGTTTFTNNSVGGSTYSWNFGDATTSTLQNPTHIYAAAGIYSVTLLVTSPSGCTSTIVQTVSVINSTTASFSTTPVCLNSTTTFTDLSTGSPNTWSWNFGDATTSTLQNPTHTYATTGTFTVTLTVAGPGGCTNTITQNVTVNPQPTAAFTATSVCLNTVTTFTDNSTGGVATWSWNFGDSNTSTLRNPTHIYATAGTFTTTLTVTASPGGCTNTINRVVTVNPLPVPAFTSPNVCFNQISNFTNTSSVAAPSTITTYAWNFGNAASAGNNISSLINPTHVFTSAGTYNVLLTVTTNNNCSTTTTVPVIVNPNPAAAFTVPPVCVSNPSVFTNSSSVSSGTITGWSWNFGDNTTGNTQNATHTYATAGSYTVNMVVTTNNGCRDSARTTVTVNPGPVANFTANPVCMNNQSTFNNLSTISSGNITGYSWSFGDATTSTLQNPTHTYTTSGTFTVTLQVSSNNGCIGNVTVPVIVNPLPEALYTNTSVCQNNQTVFTNTSFVGAPSNINQWTWNFGDATTSSLQSPSHTYTNAGTFTVSLIVATNSGCSDTSLQVVTVFGLPAVNFRGDSLRHCNPWCVNFTDQTVVTGGNISQWVWDFGDGSPVQNASNPGPVRHCYTRPGSYSVFLTTTSNQGCVSSLNKPNYITTWPLPTASFTAGPQPTTVTDTLITFTNRSSGAVAWYWNFGDGNTQSPSNPDPTHGFSGAAAGTYNVQLIVLNQYGCTDTTRETIVIGPFFTFYVPNAFTPNGDGKNDGFFGKGVGIVKFQMWIFDRWGNMLFTTEDQYQPWNGRVHGSDVICQEDVYVWKVALTDVFSNKHNYIGHVSLIK